MALDSKGLLALLFFLSLALNGIALLGLPRARRPRSLIGLAVVAGFGVLLTLALSVLLFDIIDVWHIPISWVSRLAGAAGVGLALLGVALALTKIRTPGRGRQWAARVLAVLAVPMSLITGAVAVNASVGLYRTTDQLFEAFNPPKVTPLRELTPAATVIGERSGGPTPEAQWQPPGAMPKDGKRVKVDIPGTRSGFHARPAEVWLPPAAQVAHPPILPVIVALSGQPGDPGDVLGGGDLQRQLEEYQRAHRGYAPIVVAPDMLGQRVANPLCIDSGMGNARSYFDRDVIPLIRASLPVGTDRAGWSLVGFSSGGTCVLQMGLDEPQRFRTFVAISAEEFPILNNDEQGTLKLVFNGDRAAYDRVRPERVMARHTPYRDTALILGTGEQDRKFSDALHRHETAARAAGLTTTFVTSPGTTHDFNTVRYVLTRAIPIIMQRAGGAA